MFEYASVCNETWHLFDIGASHGIYKATEVTLGLHNILFRDPKMLAQLGLFW